MSRPFVITVAVLLSGSLIPAAEARRADLIPGSHYLSARSAAMGDAGMPLGDDVASGLFNNPAILARVKELTFEPINLSLGANSDYLSKIGTKGSTSVTSLSQYQSTLQRFPGYFPSVSGSLLPNFGFEGFGVGVLYDTKVSAVAQDNGDIKYRSYYHFIPAAGFGLRLASGVIRLGYSLQYVNTAYGTVTVASGASEIGYNQNLKQGAGLGHTAAFSLNLPFTYLPALNIVARNIGGIRYQSGGMMKLSSPSNSVPDADPASYDASISYQDKTGSGGAFNVSMVARDLTSTSGVPIYGRVALGMEFSFREVFFLRGGFQSLAPSAGIGFKQKKGELSLAWYQEDVGTSYHAETDRRFMLQYQIRAF